MVVIPDILARRKPEKYFRSQPVYDQPSTQVDRENGIINNVQVIREGEARGHGVHIDNEFITEVATQGNERKNGIKSRFNHPSMSAGALGTYLGQFRNFSVKGTSVYADLHLDDSAKRTPNGDLYNYVLDMAENAPHAFGNSISFEDDGEIYGYTEEGEKKTIWEITEGYEKEYKGKYYIRLHYLHASDLVDDPAATDGLFSAKINSKAFAVQITDFLDTNPEIWDFVERHPDKLQPFLEKYRAYCERKTHSKKPTMKKKTSLFQRLYKAFTNGGTFDISVTDTEGNQLSIVTDSDEPAIGDEVLVVSESGDTEPAADGNYVVADGQYEGQTITVAEGHIADITDPKSNEPAQQPEDRQPDEVSMNALQERITELEAEVKQLRKKPAASHTSLDDEEDFTTTSTKKEYSFNEQGRKAFERGKRAASRI